MLHILLHAVVPLAIALAAGRDEWKPRFGWMMAGLVIDIDHLLADPVYDPTRCSLGFHPLHTALPIALYVGFALWPKTRWLGIGLCVHILLDGMDCWL